jgi:hypothetical protein
MAMEKVAALWVEDATSRDNEAWCSFFMEPTVEKMNLKWFVRGFILTEKPFMFLLSVKL